MAGAEGRAPPPPGTPDDIAPKGPAAGLRVLLVEDQTIIAIDTESMLSELGAASVQSFATSEDALAWLAAAQADVGVLDIQLGSTMSYPVADLLGERGIPFVFTTGYGDAHAIPERYADAPIVHKPYSVDGLAQGLARCLELHRRS